MAVYFRVARVLFRDLARGRFGCCFEEDLKYDGICLFYFGKLHGGPLRIYFLPGG